MPINTRLLLDCPGGSSSHTINSLVDFLPAVKMRINLNLSGWMKNSILKKLKPLGRKKRKFKFFKILKFFLDKDLEGIYIGHQFNNLDGFTLVFLK
jgi:hypothetical protein